MKTILVLLVAGILSVTALAGEPIRPLDRQAARLLVDAARHDRPAIIALWSTECPHCKKNLALYARLAQHEKRLRLVTIAAEPLWDGLAAPLDAIGVPGERYAYGDDAPEALAHALDPAWRGELPRTLLFDGRGGRQAISGALDEKQLRRSLGLR
jgi:thiol-disulfide isomerase/thioredoxin